MAGSGRKIFSPGEVLTASNVMNYLQDQAVMTFPGTAARGSAIGTAVSEGMVSYLADTNTIQAYTGAAWEQVFPSVANAGEVVSVKSATFVGTQSVSLASTAWADITDLTLTHAMAKSTNKVLLIAHIGMLNDSGGYASGAIRFTQAGNAIGTGTAAGSRQGVSSGMQANQSSSIYSVKTLSMAYLYTPGSTSSITYKVQVGNITPSTVTMSINASYGDTDNTSFSRTISTLTLFEVVA